MGLRQLFALVLVVAATACNRPLSCPEHFAQGAVPSITNKKLANKTRLLCFEAYAVLHSGVSRTPLWAAQYLTADSVTRAKRLKLRNAFHTEDTLPPNERAELHDYAGSRFERAHLVPSQDMPTAKAHYESFSLANIIPQNSNKNQALWEAIEEETRNLARGQREAYVVTGPVFEGSALERLNGRVLVPTSVYKAIYVPALGQAGAYYTANASSTGYETLSIAELEQRVGIDVFPQLPSKVKETRMDLPVPIPRDITQ